MPTIKDVAKQAGVSATTVSIILGGKSEQRKIPAATCERVREAARQIGYRPDPSAKRLRKGGDRKPVIAFFWPMDYRLPILASFINSISKELRNQGVECELVVQTFENDKLKDAAQVLQDHYYSAMIIGACSADDLAFLESQNLKIPVVLINRTSQRYSSVCVDNEKIGREAAEMIFRKGYRSVALLTASERYLQTRRRTTAFIDTCRALGITIEESHILSVPGNMAGGSMGAVQFCYLNNRPKMLFCESDSLALGALSAFQRLNISIPTDLEVLAISMLGQEETLYSLPSLSIIDLPNEKMASAAIRIVLKQLNDSLTGNSTPIHEMEEADIILRDSFRLPLI